MFPEATGDNRRERAGCRKKETATLSWFFKIRFAELSPKKSAERYL
jgi:hypothetical protein